MNSLLTASKKNKTIGLVLGASALVGSSLYYLYSNMNRDNPRVKVRANSLKIQDVLRGTKMSHHDEDPLTLTYLTDKQAKLRKECIGEIQYDLALCMRQDGFDGYISVAFECKMVKDGLFIDFQGDDIEEVHLNGNYFEGSPWKHHKIDLLAENLRVGENTLVVKYRNKYANNGYGLHSFTDPVDGNQYLYSHFEPYYCHKMFPCFDQPNLKATLSTKVIAPKDWHVITYDRALAEALLSEGEIKHPFANISDIISNPEEYKIHTFPESPKISTYIFSMLAGPYAVYEDDSFRVPLRIFCRQTLKKYFNPDEHFLLTKCGFDIYEEFFGYNYPFGKYDQIYCPEYVIGAMENVGAITFNESYIFKETPDDILRLHVANVILHELSHMWFGDLVTMHWWEDTWLKESFATYISYYAMDILCKKEESLKSLDQSWEKFFIYKEARAFNLDQLSSSHPVATQVTNTDEGQDNFDGITYAKGASLLKQLVSLIGSQVFSEGCKTYFARHQWMNTSLKDFLAALNEACVDHKVDGINLMDWAEEWLCTTGLNFIRPEFDRGDDNELTNFCVIQQACNTKFPTLRNHCLTIAFLNEEMEIIKKEKISIDAQRETELSQFNGLKDVVAVFLNWGDEGYVKVLFDQGSLKSIVGNMQKLPSNLERLQVWRSVWDMFGSKELNFDDYMSIVEMTLPDERSPLVIGRALFYTKSIIQNFLGDEIASKTAALMFNLTHNLIKEIADKACRRTLFAYMISFANTKEQIGLLLRWTDSAPDVEGLEVTQNSRWGIMLKLHESREYDSGEKRWRLEAEVKKDTSDVGLLWEQRCKASLPDLEMKNKYWQEFLDTENKDSNYMLVAKMEGFNRSGQRSYMERFYEPFFDNLLTVYKSMPKDFALKFFSKLYPGYRVDEDIEKRLLAIQAQLNDGDFTFKRAIIEEVDRLRIRRKIWVE